MSKKQIDGVTYNVVAQTPLGDRVELKLQRPNGRRFYYAVVYANGIVSAVA